MMARSEEVREAQIVSEDRNWPQRHGDTEEDRRKRDTRNLAAAKRGLVRVAMKGVAQRNCPGLQALSLRPPRFAGTEVPAPPAEAGGSHPRPKIQRSARRRCFSRAFTILATSWEWAREQMRRASGVSTTTKSCTPMAATNFFGDQK